MSISIKNIAFGILIGFLLSSAALVFAWTGPTAEPPASNVAAPINVGATTQTKTGSLLIDNILEADNLSVWGSIILGGVGNYLNFGTTAGTSGYGIRDNAGVMEFKNSSGSWAAIATSSSSSSSFYLYNNAHTNMQCEAAGGLVRSISSSYVCQFTGSSCPSGWTRLNNWGTTHPSSCKVTGTSYIACMTGSHEFANTAAEACTGSAGGQTCNATATTKAVGCY